MRPGTARSAIGAAHDAPAAPRLHEAPESARRFRNAADTSCAESPAESAAGTKADAASARAAASSPATESARAAGYDARQAEGVASPHHCVLPPA